MLRNQACEECFRPWMEHGELSCIQFLSREIQRLREKVADLENTQSYVKKMVVSKDFWKFVP